LRCDVQSAPGSCLLRSGLSGAGLAVRHSSKHPKTICGGRGRHLLGNSYSVNTPLRASKIENIENTCVTKTRINTVDAYVFYFQSTINFPSWTSRVRSPTPACRPVGRSILRNFSSFGSVAVPGKVPCSLGISLYFTRSLYRTQNLPVLSTVGVQVPPLASSYRGTYEFRVRILSRDCSVGKTAPEP